MGIFFALLVLTAIAVSAKLRNRDGVILSFAMLVGSCATMIVFLLINRDWQIFNGAVLLLDAIFLMGFAMIAFNSTQRWPMIVCSMQFVATASHVAGMLGDTPATRVLGVAQGLWAYIQCFAIIFGVFHNSKKTIAGPRSTETS